MHEYSLVRALADRVEAEARTRQAVAVHRLTVAIGAVSGVEPVLFETAFSLCREGILADTELEIRRVEAAWSCPSCGREIPSDAALVLGITAGLWLSHWAMRHRTLEEVVANVSWGMRSVALTGMLLALCLVRGESQAFIYFQF